MNVEENSRLKANSFIKTQSLDLKQPESSENTSVEQVVVKSEEKLMGLEFSSNLPFEAGPEYESMVSRMLEPRQSESQEQENYLKKTLRPSDLGHSQLQQKLSDDEYQEGDYYPKNGQEVNPDSEYGHLQCLNIREYLRPFARDSDHLTQLLIEQKMGRLDIMDKISEEHSVDLESSMITNVVNKSVIFAKDSKMMKSESMWIGKQGGQFRKE